MLVQSAILSQWLPHPTQPRNQTVNSAMEVARHNRARASSIAFSEQGDPHEQETSSRSLDACAGALRLEAPWPRSFVEDNPNIRWCPGPARGPRGINPGKGGSGPKILTLHGTWWHRRKCFDHAWHIYGTKSNPHSRFAGWLVGVVWWVVWRAVWGWGG